MSCHNTERLFLIIGLLALTAFSVPTYAKLAAGITARGVALSWLHHSALFALAVLLGLVGLVLCGLVLAAVVWASEGISHLLRFLRSRRR